MSLEKLLAENLLRFGIKNLNESDVENLNKLAEQSADSFESALVATFGDKSTRLWNAMSPEQKQKILDSAKEKIQGHARIKKVDFDKSLKKVKSVRIGTRPGETTITKSSIQSVIESIPYTATYPDNTKLNPELQNFYLKDNAIAVLPDRKQKFVIMVSELKRLIPNDETIKEIHILAGSTTSQVPTTYGSKDGKSNMQNNVTLAEDRCKQIEATLDAIIKEQFPQYSGQIIIDQRQVEANRGPEWTNKDRTNAAFGRPGNRTAEYNAKYGAYKGSYGSVMIIAEGKIQEKTEDSTEEQVPDTNYFISMSWGYPPNKKKKRFGRSKGGGGISVGGGVVIPKCMIW